MTSNCSLQGTGTPAHHLSWVVQPWEWNLQGRGDKLGKPATQWAIPGVSVSQSQSATSTALAS